MSGGVDISAEAVERLAANCERVRHTFRLTNRECDELAATLRALRAALDAAKRERDRWKAARDESERQYQQVMSELIAAEDANYARGVRDAANEAHERWVWGAPPEGTEGAILALLPATDATKEKNDAK